jgi:hypothetical protein
MPDAVSLFPVCTQVEAGIQETISGLSEAVGSVTGKLQELASTGATAMRRASSKSEQAGGMKQWQQQHTATAAATARQQDNFINSSCLRVRYGMCAVTDCYGSG